MRHSLRDLEAATGTASRRVFTAGVPANLIITETSERCNAKSGKRHRKLPVNSGLSNYACIAARLSRLPDFSAALCASAPSALTSLPITGHLRRTGYLYSRTPSGRVESTAAGLASTSSLLLYLFATLKYDDEGKDNDRRSL
jgi:hypothetical protein